MMSPPDAWRRARLILDPSPALAGIFWNVALALYLTAVFLETIAIGRKKATRIDSWSIGDWLINYEGGFVRRGLSGSFILTLHRLTGIRAEHIVLCLQLSMYLIIFLTLYFMIRRLTKDYWLILLCFSPATFAFQVNSANGALRKEILFIALFALVALLVSKGVGRIIVVPIASIISAILVMSHEMTIFYVIYYLWLFQIANKNWWTSIKMFCVVALPAFVLVLVVLRYGGNAEMVEPICRSLGESAPEDCSTFREYASGAISVLRYASPYEAFRAAMRAASAFNYYEKSSWAVLLLAVPWVVLLAGARSLLRPQLAIGCLLTFASTLPLFLTAVDWGRFIYIHNMLAFILVVVWKTTAERPVVAAPERRGSGSVRTHASRLAKLGLAALYCTSWYVPHYGPESIERGLLKAAVEYFRKG